MAYTKLNVNGARVSNVGTPTENTDAATKQYVDEKVPEITAGNGIAYSDGTVSVKPKTGGGIIVDSDGVSVDAATMPMPDDAAPTDNPTFTGSVTVPDPTADTDATNKEYVDGAIAAAVKNVKVPTAGTGLEQTAEGAFNVKAKAAGGIIVNAEGVSVDPETLPLPGDAAPTDNPTFTGSVTVPEPAQASDAANKGYVDSAIADAVAEIDIPTAGNGLTNNAGAFDVNPTQTLENLTVSGAATVPTPTQDRHAATKAYVDQKISTGVSAGNGINIEEGVVSVKAKASGGITVDADGVSVDAATMPMPSGAAPTNNPTFTGAVTVPTPANDTDAATKGYVDQAVDGIDVPEYTAGAGISISGDAISVNKATMPALDYLPLTGGTVNGAITVSGTAKINGVTLSYSGGVLTLSDA